MMCNRFIYSVLTVLCLCSYTLAQESDLNFRRYTKTQGLSNNDITGFAQTPDGYMWIGTSDGLNRFDGHTFKVFRHQPDDDTSINDNSITALLVDSKGVLWVGTELGGLHKYNPETESFEGYKYDYLDENSLSCTFVISIKEDVNQQLWIGTAMGLNVYLPETNNFQRYFHEIVVMLDDKSINKLKNQGLSNTVLSKLQTIKDSIFTNRKVFFSSLQRILNKGDYQANKEAIYLNARTQENATNINYIEPDSNGNLWLAYDKGGLDYFNPETSKLSSTVFKEQKINALLSDKTNLWVGLANGELYKMDINSVKPKEVPISVQTYGIESLYKDENQNLWIGNELGLFVKKGAETDVKSYQIDPISKWNVSTPTVKNIFQDSQGNIWIGILQGGVSQLLKKMTFQTYDSKESSQMQLTKDCVSSVLEDSKGRLWIGYYTSGIDMWDPKTKKITYFQFVEDDVSKSSIGRGTVFSIEEDRDGIIWIGTYEGGLQQYLPNTKSFKSYRHDPENVNTISKNDIRSIKEDSKGNLWLAVHGGGINKFNKKTGDVTRYYADYLNWENTLSNDWVYDIAIDSKDNIWIASVSGITHYIPHKNIFHSYGIENSNLSYSKIRTLDLDRHDNLWVGTEKGLEYFDSANKTFKKITVSKNLENEPIRDILSDQQGDLWIATKYSVVKLDYDSGKFEVFDESYAFSSNEFFAGASEIGKNGNLYFGGFQGLLALKPEKVTVKTLNVPLVLTAVSVNHLDNTLLSYPLNADGSRQSKFKHDQNSIRLSYTGVNFEQNRHVEYAYKLEGFDNDWNYVKDGKEANYTNLPDGNYDFKVKLSNIHNVWTAPQTLMRFQIQSAWWQTIYAQLIYALGALLLILIYRKYVITAERKRHNLRLEEMQANFVKEFDALKVKFYAGISKDLQAPFGLIRSPLQTLISENETISPKKRLTYFKLINQNARKVIRLIEKLSDISAFDSDSKSLKISKYDIIQYGQTLTNSFNYRAKQKDVSLEFESNLDSAEVYFDVDKLEKALYYLISHAFQCSPSNGFIKVRIDIGPCDEEGTHLLLKKRFGTKTDFAKVMIENTGLPNGVVKSQGKITTNEKDILESNYAVALVKQLTLLHLGSFDLSFHNKNTQYTMYIPVSKHVFSSDQIVDVPDLVIRKEILEASISSDLSEETLKENGFWSTQGVTHMKDEESPFLMLLYEIIDAQIGNNDFGPETLAEYMNLSRSQLYKKVKSLTDLSVSIVIRNRRLNKSLALLANTDYSISEVAYAMGFNDPAYYTKCFKKLYGKSPSAFMQSI